MATNNKYVQTLEREIEKYLISQVLLHGGELRKLTWINRRNAPDRLVMLNGAWFVELKRPGEEPRLGQVREFFRMKQLGCPVKVLDSKEKIDVWIKRIAG